MFFSWFLSIFILVIIMFSELILKGDLFSLFFPDSYAGLSLEDISWPYIACFSLFIVLGFSVSFFSPYRGVT
jgi:hypothetical protein